MAHLDHIRSYYESLNTGDVDLVASHFTDDATHYYTRLGPHHGREIAENAKWGIDNLDAKWHYDHGIEQGDEAVIEWAMTWRDLRSGEERINRGTGGSASRTAGSPRSAPTTTATARTPAATCSASTPPAAAIRRSAEPYGLPRRTSTLSGSP